MTARRTAAADGTPLVGRARELAVLIEAAAVATRLRGARLVVIKGAAGLGKTSLLAMAQATLAGRDTTVQCARGRTDAGDYDVVRELLDRGRPVDSSRRPALAGHDGYVVLDHVFDHVAEMATGRSLVFLVDDADDCDLPSLCCLDFVLRRAADLPLLVVLSHRGTRNDPIWGLLTARSLHATVDLGPLSGDDLAAVVAASTGCVPDQRFVDACTELTGGEPGKLQELLAALSSAGARPDPEGALVATQVGPHLLARSALKFLNGRPRWTREITQAIAVLGPVDSRLVAGLVRTPAVVVERTVAELREHRILVLDRLDFVHDRIRESVLAQMPTGELDALRVRAARLMHDEGRPSAEIARLLVLLPDLGEPWMHAVLWEAASEARRSRDAAGSARLLSRVVDAMPNDAASIVELTAALSELDPDAATAHFVRAMETPDVRTRVSLVERLGELALSSPPKSSMFRVLADALDARADESAGRLRETDPDLCARVESGMLAAGLGDLSSLPDALERTRHIPVPDATTPANRTLLGQLAGAAMLDGRPASHVLPLARAAVSGPAAAADLDNGVVFAAAALHLAGAPDEAMSAVSAALDNERSNKSPIERTWLRTHALCVKTSVLLETGNVSLAVEATQAASEHRALEPWATSRLAAAGVLLELGEFTRARLVLARLRNEELPSWDRQLARLAEARTRNALGDPESAAAILIRSLADGEAVVPPMLVASLAALTCVLARLGHSPATDALLEPWLATAEHWGTRESLAMATLVRGLRTSGNRGLELLGKSVALLTESPYVLFRVRAEYLFGRALLDVGDTAGARRYARSVIVGAARHGYVAVGSDARALLIAAGGRMKEPSGRREDVLTASERRVARLAAAGATNREIAKMLSVSLRTVELHLSSTYRKLGLKSRRQLASLLRDCLPPRWGLTEAFL